MNWNPLVIEVLQIIVLLAVAPAFTGWVRMLKCWSQGRTSPGLFQFDAEYAVATHLDGSVVQSSNPGLPGEVIVLRPDRYIAAQCGAADLAEVTRQFAAFTCTPQRDERLAA